MATGVNLNELEGEKLYLELVKGQFSLDEKTINEKFMKLDGRWLYEAGKVLSKVSNDSRKKAFKKLDGKYVVEAMKSWKGLTKEEKKEGLGKLVNDGRLYDQALKIIEQH